MNKINQIIVKLSADREAEQHLKETNDSLSLHLKRFQTNWANFILQTVFELSSSMMLKTKYYCIFCLTP